MYKGKKRFVVIFHLPIINLFLFRNQVPESQIPRNNDDVSSRVLSIA